MNEHYEPERAALRNLDNQDVIPYLGIRKAEGKFVAGCIVAGMVLGQLGGVPELFILTVGGSLFFAMTAVYASPSHLTTWRYIKDLARYAWRPSIIFAASDEAPQEMKNEGGLANRTPFKVDTRTQDLTNIQKAWTGAGAVLRTDGRVEAMVEIRADNMDFARAPEWMARQEAAKEYANKSLEDSLKIHATTESYDIQQVINRLEDRLSDPDIRDSATKRALLEEYRERRPGEIKDRGTQTVRAFIPVSVRKREVTDSYQGETSGLQKLAQIPVLGILFSPFTRTTGDMDEQELNQAVLDELDHRVHQEVMSEFVQKMPGYSGRRLSTLEIFTLNARFFNGNKPVYDDLQDVVSDQAVKTSGATEHGGSGMTLEQALPGPRVGPDLPPELWNTLFGWIPGTEAVSAPTPAPAVVVGGLVALLGVTVWRWRQRSRIPTDQSDVREATLSSMLQEENRQTGAEQEAGSSIGSEVGPGDTDAGMGETFQDISESHDDLMAASAIESETRTANVGGEYTKTLHIQDMDEQPSDGLLSPLWELTDAKFDVTVYFTEKNQSIARENLRDRADDLQVDADDEDSSRSNYLQAEANKASANHEAAESGTKVFDFSMWVTVRGDTLEELEENERKIRRALREDPASLVPKTAIGKQVQAIQSAAPLGPDILGDKDPEYYKMPLMAGGVGAFLASPTNPTFTEPTGIEVGKHKTTQTPVIVDPTERENGHAWFLIADVAAANLSPAKPRSHDSLRNVRTLKE